MFILGIVGRKRSGKDEVCKIVQSYYAPYKVLRISFADALKEEVGLAIGQTTCFIDNNKDNFRLILQGWGTDFRRKLSGENYWVEKWLLKLRHIPSSTYGVIATDVRFLNEAKVIRQVNGMLWRVNRADSTDMHVSETEQDKITVDATIDNTGTLEQLDTNIKHQLTKWHISQQTR